MATGTQQQTATNTVFNPADGLWYPPTAGSTVSSGNLMTFAAFVNAYVPNHRSGQPWQPSEIVTDSGMTLTEVTAFLTYIHQKQQAVPPPTLDQLAALNPIIETTPFGIVLYDPPTTSQPTNALLTQPLGSMLAGDFLALLKAN